MSQFEIDATSGVATCSPETTFGELVDAIQASGWCLDGIQPEPSSATVGRLLSRRQPRPPIFNCGLIAASCCRLAAEGPDGHGYEAIGAPRRSMGPDLRYLYIGGEGRFGRIRSVGVATVRPPAHYVVATGSFETLEALFEVTRLISFYDPKATRRISLFPHELTAGCPVRPGRSAHAVSDELTDLGLEFTDVEALDREFRVLNAAPTSGRWFSAGYGALTEAIGWVREQFTDDIELSLRYPDTHGATLVVATVEDADGARDLASGLMSRACDGIVAALGARLDDSSAFDAAAAAESGVIEPRGRIS